MTVIETSKLLLECADWLEKIGNHEKSILIEQGMDNSDSHFLKWAAAIRSIAIPEPVKEEFTNQKCPRCGMITANIFACGHCKNPNKLYEMDSDIVELLP